MKIEKLKQFREPIIDLCAGCGRIEEGFCLAYISPKYKWSDNSGSWCNFNDIPHHIIEEKIKVQKKTGAKKMINPLKFSKRGGQISKPMMPRFRTISYDNKRIKRKYFA